MAARRMFPEFGRRTWSQLEATMAAALREYPFSWLPAESVIGWIPFLEDLRLLKRIVGVGRDAHYDSLLVDLGYPSARARRRLMVASRDSDMPDLAGYEPRALRYIPMNPTNYQLDFLAARGHTEISIEAARDWLSNE